MSEIPPPFFWNWSSQPKKSRGKLTNNNAFHVCTVHTEKDERKRKEKKRKEKKKKRKERMREKSICLIH